MAKVSVTFNFSFLRRLQGRQFLSASDMSAVGQAVVDGSKALIARGVSPVRDWGRFPAYKAQRSAAKVKALRESAKSVQSKKAQKAIRVQARNISDRSKQRDYPFSVMGKYPGKKVRPVNLYLSGEMLSHLTFKRTGKETIEVGIIDAPSEIETIARAHNEGPTDGKFPQRRFLPVANGERYALVIERAIREIYRRAVDRIVAESNGK